MLLGAVAAGAIAAGALDGLRGPLAALLSHSFDRAVTIGPGVALNWHHGPALAVHDLHVEGMPGGPAVLEAARVDVVLDPQALLGGHLALAGLAIDGAVLRPAALGHTSNAPHGKAAPAPAPDLHFLGLRARFVLTDSRIELGTTDGTALRVDALTLDLTDGNMELAARLGFAGRAIEMTASSGPMADLLSSATWPIDAVMTAGDDRLTARGTVSGALGQATVDIALEGSGPDLDVALQSFGLEPVYDGPYSLAGHLSGTARRLALEGLALKAGEAGLTGDLLLEHGLAAPALSGHLAATGLPDLGGDTADDDQAMLDTPIPFDRLHAVELDLDLTIEHVSFGHLVLGDVKLPLRLRDGRLDVTPVSVTVEGQPLVAHLHAVAERSEISVGLEADRLPFGPALQRWRPGLDIDGEAEDVKLDALATGTTLRDMLASLTLDLDGSGIDLTTRFSDGSQVQLALDSLKASSGTSQPLRVAASGTLDGIAATVSLISGSLDALMRGDEGWPIEFHAGHDEIGIDLTGVLMHPHTMTGLRLEGLVRGREIGRLAELAGVALPLRGAVEIYLHISDRVDGVSLDWFEGTIGESDLAGNVELGWSDDTTRVKGEIDSKRLVLAPARGGDREVDLDAVIWHNPSFGGIEADVGIDIGTLVLPEVKLGDISGRIAIADSVMTIKQSRATVFGTATVLDVTVDRSVDPATITFALALRDIDPRLIGDDLGLHGLLEGSIASIRLDVATSGDTLRQLAANAVADLAVEKGSLEIGDGAVPFEFERLTLASRPGEGTTGVESFVMGGVPIELELGFVPLADLLSQPSPWTLTGKGKLLGIEFEIARQVTPELNIYERPVALRATAADLRTALAGLGMDLPKPLPLAAEGTMQVFPDHIAFDLDRTTLGGSDLAGHLEVALQQTPPRIGASFSAQRVVVDDVIADDGADEEVTDTDVETLLATPLPPWTLPAVALDVRLDAALIDWGGYELHDVGTRLLIDGKALHIDDMEAKAFGGTVDGSVSLAPAGESTTVIALLDIAGIDSDKAVRLLGLADAAQGEVTVQAGIHTGGTTVAGLLGDLDGYFLLQRGEGWIQSGGLHLLSTNILSAALSTLFDPRARTPVRCIVLDLELQDGQGTLDTSLIALEKVVIEATGGVDLDAMTVDALMTPESTTSTFLRMLTPVHIRGSLLDPSVEPSAGGVLLGLGSALIGAGPRFDQDLGLLCRPKRHG